MSHLNSEWHRWFAWYPVELGYGGGLWIWMQVVERRLVEMGDIEWWEYRHIDPDEQALRWASA